MVQVFILEEQTTEGLWSILGVYSSYEKAQNVLIHLIGLKRIREFTLDM